MRQEIQTQVNDCLEPGAAGRLHLDGHRKTTVRGGYGIFYDWFDANLYEQTLRVDGEHQYDVIVENPSFPVITGAGTRLPAEHHPRPRRSTSRSSSRPRSASSGRSPRWAGLRMDYMWTRGSNTLRSVNVNAPVDGVRPDPTSGNISEIQSTGRRASDRLTVGVNARHERLRIFTNVMYQLQSSRNYADSATSLPSDSTNPDADWGPSAQDIRHRLFVMFNAPIWKGIRAGLNMQVASAAPYNITTGRDDNGDTVFNDRPAGVGAQQRARRQLGERDPAAEQVVRFRRPGRGAPAAGCRCRPLRAAAVGRARRRRVSQRRPRWPGGGDGPQMVIMEGANSRYRLDFYAQITNLFNYVNYNTFIGNQLSPFFGTATSAGTGAAHGTGLLDRVLRYRQKAEGRRQKARQKVQTA